MPKAPATPLCLGTAEYQVKNVSARKTVSNNTDKFILHREHMRSRAHYAPVIPSRRVSPDSLLMAARCYEAKRTPQYACNGALKNDGGALQQKTLKRAFSKTLTAHLSRRLEPLAARTSEAGCLHAFVLTRLWQAT